MASEVHPGAAELARWASLWIESDTAPTLPAGLSDWPLMPLAWQIKNETERVFTAAPVQTARCAAALERLARAHGEADGLLAALSAWAAGIASLAQGQPQPALDRLEQAERALHAMGDSRHAHQTLVPQMVGQAMLGRHDRATACGESALAAFDADGDTLAAGKVELNLGSMLLRQDRYTDAAACFRRAALRFARAGDHANSIKADIGLAQVLTAQHDFEGARQMSERARQRALAHGVEPLLAPIHSILGRLELFRGRLGDALRWLAQALHDYERHGPPQALAEAQRTLADAYLAALLLPEGVALYERVITHSRAIGAQVEEAWALVRAASAQMRMGAAGDAASGLERAMLLFRSQGNGVGVATVTLHLAALSLHGGDATLAGRLAQQAAEGFRGAGLHGWQLEAQTLVAQAWMQLGDRAAARALFQQTLEAAAGLPHLEARCAQGLGRLALADAQAEQARRWYERAAELVELQRRTLVGDEIRTAFADDKQESFDVLVQLAWAELPRSGAWPLLQAIERGRSRALHHSLLEGPLDAQEPDPASQALRTRLQWLQGQWRDALTRGDSTRVAHWQAQRREVEHELLEQSRRRRLREAPEIAEAQPGAEETSIGPALLNGMAANEAVIVYHRLGERLIACVIRRSGVQVVDCDAVGVESRIDQLRFQISALRFRAGGLASHNKLLFERTRAHLALLYRRLWEPLVPLLAGCEQVTVVPHGKLHYVPFCALHDGDSWLVERHVLAQAPSLAVWSAFAPWRPRLPSRVVAIGVGGNLLPHVAAELAAVRAAFPAAVVLDGHSARVAALRDAAAGADIVHLACHGEFRADSPYFSELALAGETLTLSDAATLPLQGSLVTLSACETGVSLVSAGDEVIGLVRGFLMAGAASVISTLWTVDDQTTAELMARFYAGLHAGARPARALAVAQRELLQSSPHPYHWAPFTLHGRDPAMP